jgi:acyl CoA:acetate/3-ketoacid CoA transferase alpha subunit
MLAHGGDWCRICTEDFHGIAGAADYVIFGAVDVVEVDEIDPNNVVRGEIMANAIAGDKKLWHA